MDGTGTMETRLIRWHGRAALIMLVVATLFGVAVSMKMHWPDFLGGSAWSTWGRLRYNHTQGILFGWLTNGFLAFLYFAVPRLARRPVLSARLGWLIFWVWNGCVVLPGWVLVSLGFSQPLEWAEFPLVVDAFVVLSLALLCAQFVGPFLLARRANLYVSAWYVIGGLAFTLLAYPIGNVVPELLPGATGAAFSGLWIHDAVGLFVTPMALSIAYFVIPLATGKPIYSHFLSLVGFWLLFFLYPLNGTHHYIYSSIPMSAQVGAVWASALLGVDVILVVTNLLLSLRGTTRAGLPLRFVWTGVVFYLVVSLQGSLQAIMPINRYVHFTDWVIGHSHLAMFGFASFIMIGGVTFVWSRLPGARLSEAWLNWSYWLLLTGLAVMVLDLTLAGIAQAALWQTAAPWLDSIRAARGFWVVRTLTALPVLAGFACLSIGLTRGAPADVAAAPPMEEPTLPARNRLESAYVLTFVAGLGFFAFSFFLLGVLPAQALERQIAGTRPFIPPPPAALETEGRAIYAREGCAYCHTQQVRFVARDQRRFGDSTEAWETSLEYPQMWGTRRVGPDLAREGSIRPRDWQFAHLYHPQSVVADSNMPSYPWLFAGNAAQPTREGQALVAYIESLGRYRSLAGPAYGTAEANTDATLPASPAQAAAVGTTAHLETVERQGDLIDNQRRAAELFAANCAGCHGSTGHGDGPAAAGLLPRPADLSATRQSSGRLSQVLWAGVPQSAMPAWRDLPEADLALLARYVRSLAPRRVDAPEEHGVAQSGGALFAANCAACHGAAGQGDGPAAAALAPAPTDFTRQQPAAALVDQVLQSGRPGTAMPPWPRLSAADRAALTAFVRSLYQPETAKGSR